MEKGGGKIWILTGSLDNFQATAEHGFRVIGMKERRRGLAEQIQKGDVIVFYVAGVQAFAATVLVTSDMYEDRTPLWPGKPGNPDPYPWRFESEPEVVLEPEDWVDAAALKDRLEHVAKWPAEHWTLAFQGQLRAVSERDAAVLLEAMTGRVRA